MIRLGTLTILSVVFVLGSSLPVNAGGFWPFSHGSKSKPTCESDCQTVVVCCGKCEKKERRKICCCLPGEPPRGELVFPLAGRVTEGQAVRADTAFESFQLQLEKQVLESAKLEAEDVENLEDKVKKLEVKVKKLTDLLSDLTTVIEKQNQDKD